MKLLKPTKEQVKQIRAIAKVHGVKGCKQPLHAVHVGRQTVRLDSKVAAALVTDLEASGFYVEECGKKLIAKGLADSFMVHKAA